MSIKTRHSRDEHGEPVWTITLTGWHSITRFAANLLSNQVEFSEAGAKALRWQRAAMGARRFEMFLNPFYPAGDGDSKRRHIIRASKRVRDE